MNELAVQLAKASPPGVVKSISSPPQASYSLAFPSNLKKNKTSVSVVSVLHSKGTSSFPFLNSLLKINIF
jgi:hypothetical protein